MMGIKFKVLSDSDKILRDYQVERIKKSNEELQQTVDSHLDTLPLELRIAASNLEHEVRRYLGQDT